MEVQYTDRMFYDIKMLVNVLGSDIVKELSSKYKFDSAEALEYLKLDSRISGGVERKNTNTKKKIGIPLPFCGKINESNCYGVRLYTMYKRTLRRKWVKSSVLNM